MSAVCYWSLEMSVADSEKYMMDILGVLYQIVHVEPDKGERVFSIKKEKERVTISTDNGKAKYIWGDNYLDPASDIYIETEEFREACIACNVCRFG